MKIRILALLCLSLLTSTLATAQKSLRIGYVDMNYILSNVDEYQQANKHLNEKVLRWKMEMDKMQNEITKMQDELNAERVLLTKELIEEREEEIEILQGELFDYQQQRFGPDGDLILQKENLVKPIQDQVFSAIQDIGKKRKFDFVFDKSSDFMMLYADKKYDISDIVLASINRTEKLEEREKALDEFEKKTNPALIEREKRAEERRQALEEKRKQREEEYQKKRQALLEKRQAQQEERERKKKEKEEANEEE